MSIAVEREIEHQLQEVSAEELSECGWGLWPRRDGHVFTILIRQGIDLSKALLEGRGIYTRHQFKSMQGELMPGSHIDPLDKGKLQEQEIINTVDHPSIGHSSYIVLGKLP